MMFQVVKVGGGLYIPRKSKDQTLPSGRESFTWIILKTSLCLVLDFQGVYIYISQGMLVTFVDFLTWGSNRDTPQQVDGFPGRLRGYKLGNFINCPKLCGICGHEKVEIKHEPRTKSLLAFHYTGWLIGVLMMVHHNPIQLSFVHCSHCLFSSQAI